MAKWIQIQDQNNNKITLDADGITLSSDAGIKIVAKQNVAISALNINNTANVGFTAKGNATAELSASGETTIKGVVVLIN